MAGEIAIIVLAAGMGTRMQSALPKVLHRAAGRSLLGHVLVAATELGAHRAVVVNGPGMDAVAGEARRHFTSAEIVEQRERKGTGHAVAMAQKPLQGFTGTVLVLYGDVPLITAETLRRLVGLVSPERPLAVLGFRARDPHGYGRLIETAPGTVSAIVEELDATPEQRAIRLCNSGIIAAQADLVWRLLPRITNDNAKGEFYLTDLIGLASGDGLAAGLAECEEAEVQGVNDRVQLAIVEAGLQARYRERAMRGGATLIAPETVTFRADTVIGRDVVIEPYVIFGSGVTVGDGVEILGFSHIEGARIGAGSRIGPFARLRPGAEIGAEAHIGNFVEIKNAEIARGAKVNHLSYIGDARVGAKSNIGAGTITCNYDGFDKHLTEIGAEVFIGSNSALIAPVRIADGANVAAGSVINRDVPADALAIGRPELVISDGVAKRLRDKLRARKQARLSAKGTS